MGKIKNILIVGGLGFVGCHLAQKCVELGHTVTILSRSDKKLKNIAEIKDRVKLVYMDLKDIHNEVKGFDWIFNLAGSTDNYAIIEGDPYRDIRMNCTNTIALLEACKKYNPAARIFFASTFFVNGQPEKLPVNGKSPTLPLGLYGATRLAGEHFCRIYNNVFGMNIFVARFTNVFGPKEQTRDYKKAGFNWLITKAVKGETVPVYDRGDFYRDYIFVTDVASACIAILAKGNKDTIYYVGRGEYVKFIDLMKIVLDETGAKAKMVPTPEFHGKVGIRDFVCDNSELRKLGWVPKVGLREGIKKTIDYYSHLYDGETREQSKLSP